jgi:hypothetical protein
MQTTSNCLGILIHFGVKNNPPKISFKGGIKKLILIYTPPKILFKGDIKK